MTTMLNVERVPLGKLVLSVRNVRTNVEDATDTAELQASIAAHGLLNPLVVVPAAKKGTFEVVAGGRRYRALTRLADAGTIKDDAEIPVIKAANEGAEELSLAENYVRKAMRPYEIYRAFTLFGDGKPETLTERFGLTAKQAARVLRLGNLHSDIFEAYTTGKIDDEQAQAFASTADHDRQAEAWGAFNRATNHWDKSASAIRKLLGLGDWNQRNNLLYVGRDAYLAAGGIIEEDLFGDSFRIASPELLDTLVAEKKAYEAAAIQARCTRPVPLIKASETPSDWRLSRRVEYGELSAEDQTRADEIAAQMDEIADSGSEDQEAYEKLEDELHQLMQRRPIVVPDEGEWGLCVQNGPTLWRLDAEPEEPKAAKAKDDEPADEVAPSKKATEVMASMRRQRLIERTTSDLSLRCDAIDLLIFTVARSCLMGAINYDTAGLTTADYPDWRNAEWMQERDFEAAYAKYAAEADSNALAAELLARLTKPKLPSDKSTYIDWIAKQSAKQPWQSSEEFWSMFNKRQVFKMLGEVIPSFERIYSNSKLAEVREKAHQICSGQVDAKITPLDAGELSAAQDWVPSWLRFQDE